MKKLAVVAFGGNALIRAGQKGTIDEQEDNVYETCESLLELIKQDYNIVITHGNGPQVGNILLQNIAGAKLFGVTENNKLTAIIEYRHVPSKFHG